MNMQQKPDSKPGPYYVSAIDAGKKYLVAGPYTNHSLALADVDRVRDIAGDYDGRACFMAWGTCRVEGSQALGSMNKLGLI